MKKKARDAYQERDVAIPACRALLNTIGVPVKNQDNPHYEGGVPDYYLSIPNGNEQPIATLIEVKAGGLVFPFDRITQWSYMDYWQRKTGGVTWFYILVGTESVASRSVFFRRTAYLAPFDAVWDAYLALLSATDGQQSTMPMNEYVPRVRNGSIYRENNLFMDSLFAEYRLEKKPGQTWTLPHDHMFLRVYRLNSLMEAKSDNPDRTAAAD